MPCGGVAHDYDSSVAKRRGPAGLECGSEFDCNRAIAACLFQNQAEEDQRTPAPDDRCFHGVMSFPRFVSHIPLPRRSCLFYEARLGPNNLPLDSDDAHNSCGDRPVSGDFDVISRVETSGYTPPPNCEMDVPDLALRQRYRRYCLSAVVPGPAPIVDLLNLRGPAQT